MSLTMTYLMKVKTVMIYITILNPSEDLKLLKEPMVYQQLILLIEFSKTETIILIVI